MRGLLEGAEVKEIGVLEQMRREGIYMKEPCEMPPYRRNDWAYVALVWCGLGALAAMCAYGAVLMVRFVLGWM